MSCEPPKLKQYRDFGNHMIGDRTIDIDGMCANSNYCVPFFGSSDTKRDTNTTNAVLCGNCKDIGGNLNNIYYNTGLNDTIQKLVTSYNTDYCALYKKNTNDSKQLLSTNRSLNETILNNQKVIQIYNTELTKQQETVRANTNQISQLNSQIGSSKAQNDINKEDNVYIGASSVGLGFEVSSQTYFWSMLGIDIALVGLLVYLIKKKSS